MKRRIGQSMVMAATACGLAAVALLGVSQAACSASPGTPSPSIGETTATAFVLNNTIAIREYPKALAVGDFNRDGSKDLAVLNTRPSTVSILLGRGDGTFGRRHVYDISKDANAIAVADLNGGGKPDLVIRVAQRWKGGRILPGNVSVLLGRGDGTFKTKRDYGLGYVEDNWTGPALTTADVNGDGRPDVVTAEGHKLVVLLSHGDGTLATARTFPVGRFSGGAIVALALGRLNSDRKPDAVVARYWGANEPTGDLSVLLGAGKAGFGPARTEDTGFMLPFSVAVSDLNHDGRRDRIVTWRRYADVESLPAQYPAVSVSLGLGNGTFAPATDYDLGTTDVWTFQLADFNGDGNRDVLLTFLRGVRLLNGNGDGTLQPAQQVDSTMRRHGAALAVADFTNDGKPDFVVEGSQTGTLDFYLNVAVAR